MKVSVITPSLNQGQFIGRTLQSVATQGMPDMEHIVVDGGSSDDTAIVLSGSESNVWWVSESDRGQAEAVNKGLKRSTGEIIGWLNSDDIYYPGAVRQVADFMDRNPEVDVVYGMADHIGADDVPFEPYPTEPWNPERLMDTCFICQPALFFRRRIIEKFGYLDESLNYCMDYEYWLRLARGGARFAYITEKLAGSRLYPDNKTMRAAVAVHHEINDMLRRQFDDVPEDWLYKYANVVVRSRVDEQAAPVRFARETSMRTLYASLRWNHRITLRLLRRLFPRQFPEN